VKGNKADRRSRRTRRLIAEALIALMLEGRYDHITVQEIIDRADVGRSTFYAHYRDKEDVLTSEAERVLALLHLDPDDTGGQQLLPSLSLFRHVQEQHHLYHALVRGHGVDLLYETGQRYLSARRTATRRAGERWACARGAAADPRRLRGGCVPEPPALVAGASAPLHPGADARNLPAGGPAGGGGGRAARRRGRGRASERAMDTASS